MTPEKAILNKRVSYYILWAFIIYEILFLYIDIFLWMKMAWFTYPPDRFGPAVLVIFLCYVVYLLIKQPKVPFNSSPKGLIVVITGVITYLIGNAADLHIVQAFSFILTVFGVVLYIMGYEWGKKVFFPFAFLILMLPTISFLLESTLGILLRSSITILSGSVLSLTDGAWEMYNGVLRLNEIDLPIKYYRDSISSPLALLILIFIAAEIIFKKNRHKFLFVILLCIPLVIAAHSVFTILMGWTYEHEHIKLSEAIWNSKRWLPAIMLTFILLMIGILIKIKRKIWVEKIDEKK